MRPLLLLLALACAEERTAPPLPPLPATLSTDPTPEDQRPADAPARVRARHILVAYEGALGAKPSLRRSREEAWQRVNALRDRILAGEDLGALARTESDDGSSSRGGDLGAFGWGAMQADFEQTVFGLSVDAPPVIVETPFGFHLVQRTALSEVHLGQVLVPFAGAPGSTTTRSKDEARAQAELARSRLLAGEPLSTVAPALSEGPNGSRGGDLGWFLSGELNPVVEPVAFSLSPGGVSDVVESPLGFHVLVRLEG